MVGKAIKLMSVLLAANAEAVILVFLASWISKWLNQTVPLTSISWFPICLGFSIILILYSWYVILRLLIMEAKKTS